MSDREFGRVCEHGRLARVCPECEAAETIAELRADVARLQVAVEAFVVVIMSAAPLAWVHEGDADGANKWERVAHKAVLGSAGEVGDE